MSDDWQDPFAEDPEAIERERRRAEREARRRARREALAKKVSEQPTAGSDPAGAPGPPPRSAPAAARARAEQALERIRSRGPSAEAMRRRRIGGLVLGVAALALLGFGAIEVADRIGGDDPDPKPSAAVARGEDLTIPEGYDIRQIAGVAEEAGLRGNYERAARGFRGFDPSRYGAADPPSLEGFLFPATYELPRKPTVDDLIARQLQAFRDNFARVDMSYAESKNLNEYDVLKIASMIEREIQVPSERKLAAAVIYNRLAAQDTLGIDATIRYEDQNYDEQLTESRLAEDTPYNTRTNPGLPPTPIGNPGLASIRAAANPARSDAYYFVVKPGTCGEHVFVETQEEFAEAEAAYQQALAEEGGSPTDC
jgi:YceG-like family